ncbi:MAG: acylneuraminate cytidylyltransferase family protein [Candidatus Gastranaerophilaceae bacterium]|jgi:CMP-N-acetylneuraminic acid synthetase
MKIVAIIPARGGSKRIPRKNIKLIAGKPLVAYSIEAGLESKYVDRVIVSTEDKEIAEISKQYGAEVFIRPMELAQDETKTSSVMVDVVENLEKEGYCPDIVVLLQPTSPLRNAQFINEALEQFFKSPENDSIFSAHVKCHTMPLWKKHHSGGLTCLYDYHLRPRSQERHLNELLYSEDGAFYAIKFDAFKKCKDFIGENPCIYETPYKVDVDHDNDFKLAEQMLLGGKATL